MAARHHVRNGLSLALPLLVVALSSVPACAQEPGEQAATAETKREIVSIAEAWTRAWNDEDLELMSQLHDGDLLYYWRGQPRGYETFIQELREFIFPAESISVELLNPQVQLLTSESAVVGFQMRGAESATDDPDIAVTLVVIRRATGWKIIHIHESPVRL